MRPFLRMLEMHSTLGGLRIKSALLYKDKAA